MVIAYSVADRPYAKIPEFSVFIFLESTSMRGENYRERQRRSEASSAGMNEGNILFAPKGVSQAGACDCKYNQTPP